ncbi:MAG: catalase family protein [Arenicella sp.]
MSTNSGQDSEAIPHDEQQHIDSLIASLRGKMEKDYASKRMLRDAHPKMHACVKAEFTVDADLPADLAVGLFAKPQSYQTWVRFSNAASDVSPDIKGDIRGIGLKLMGVPGEKLLPDQTDCLNQDFLLISYDRFIARNVAEFDGLVKGLVGSPIRLILFMLTHLRVAYLTIKSLQKVASVLDIHYFSAVPYLLGDKAVKYVLIPKQVDSSQIPDDPSDNYLGEELIKRLGEQSVVYDFAVQLQADKAEQPIEDPTVVWEEDVSPFRKVATLTLLQQSYNPADRQDFGDNLSFNPWRCTAEHKPLGGFGRARKQVYMALSKFRHERNKVPQSEPKVDGKHWKE